MIATAEKKGEEESEDRFDRSNSVLSVSLSVRYITYCSHDYLQIWQPCFIVDLTKVGMGAVRSKRFAMVVEDMKVTYIGVETQ